MANATVSRLGLVNNSGTGYDALFLKVFSGEVLTAFSENNIFNDSLHNVRTISSGKSAQFPLKNGDEVSYDGKLWILESTTGPTNDPINNPTVEPSQEPASAHSF